MATTIKSLRFGSSAWVPRGGDSGPSRATMVVIVTVAGFDTGTLIPDLAQFLDDSLSWAKLYTNIVPLDSCARSRRSTSTRSRNASEPCLWSST